MAQRLGLALSGGAVRAIAHVGVLKVLEEEGIPVGAISGTSGGSIVAVLYAAGLPVADMIHQALHLRWRQLTHIAPNPLGFLSTEPIRRFLETWIGEPRFEDLRIPCAVVATDLADFTPHLFRQGPVLPAVEASCAIPHLFRPVGHEGRFYLDGGIMGFLPVPCLWDLGADATVAVSTKRTPPQGVEPRNIVHLMSLFSGFVQYRNYLETRHLADLLILPALAQFPAFDLENAEKILAEGERAARQALPRLRRLLERDGPEPEQRR